MTTQLLPLVFAGGMDQSNNTTVGSPIIHRLERARFVEPGQIVKSLGYAWAADLEVPYPREVFQVGGTTCVIAVDSGYFTVLTRNYTGNSTDTALTFRYPKIPALEAPYRVRWLPWTTAYPTPGTGTAVRVCAVALAGDAAAWLLLASVERSAGAYNTSWALYDGIQFVRAGDTVLERASVAYENVGVVISQQTGTRYLWARRNTYLYQLTYSVAAGSWSDSQLCVEAGMTNIIDASAHRYFFGTDVLLTFLHVADELRTVNVTDDTFVRYSCAPSGGASGLSMGVVAWGLAAVRVTANGWVRAYDATTGTAIGAEAQALVGYTPTRITISNEVVVVVEPGTYGTFDFVVAAEYQVSGAPPMVACSRCRCANGTITVQVVTTVPHATLAGRPLYYNGDWYVPVCNDGPVSRAFRVQLCHLATGSTTTAATSTLSLAFGCHGEMPVQALSDVADATATAPWQFPQVDTVQIWDSIRGVTRDAMVFPFTAVDTGVLTGSDCIQNASALLVPTETGTIPFRGLRPTECDGNASIVAGGSPWLEGSDSMASGYMGDAPTPVVTEGALGAVFSAGAIYQYAVTAEFRDASGNLHRSPPSQPVSITPSVGRGVLTVNLGSWLHEHPKSPGIVRLYRTTADGTVFYATGATTTHATLTIINDTVTDANLIDGAILYTQGNNAFGGLKPKYGVPPHRFSARGKERLIVGGLEKPNRVRWSLTLYPGEGIAFPHPSEPGWFMDLPCSEVTAAWSLDDAWVIASRDRIWLVYGQGPDDNGANGSFELPRLVAPSQGILTQKSLCEIPEGLLFQAPDSQIYLLVRGQYQVVQFSAPVKDELYAGIVDGWLRNPILASTFNEDAQTVTFWRGPESTSELDSMPIVYDVITKAWSLDGDGESEGLTGCISAGRIRVLTPAGHPTGSVASVTPGTAGATGATGKVTVENVQRDNDAGSPQSPDVSWQASVTTNDFAPFGFGGWGAVQRVSVITGLTSGDAALTGEIWRNRSQGDPESFDFSESSGSASFEYPQLTHAINLAKMSAVRVRLTWDSRELKPAGLVFEVEPAQRAERTGSSKRT